MGIEQSHGTFYITGVEVTKAETAGGIDGFPEWTKTRWKKKQQEKLDREAKSGKKN